MFVSCLLVVGRLMASRGICFGGLEGISGWGGVREERT